MNLRKLMLISSLILAPIASISLAQTGSSNEPQETGSDRINAISNLVKAQADYTRAVAEAQLNLARADLIEAQTMNELQKVRERTLLVNRLEVELRRLIREEYLMRQKIQSIEKNVTTMSVIMSGNVSSYSLTALGYLQINAFAPADVYAVMSEKIDLSIVNELETAKEPFIGDNVGQLLNYVKINNLKVQPWGRIHQVIANAVVKLSDSSAKKLDEINAKLAALRDKQINSGAPQGE